MKDHSETWIVIKTIAFAITLGAVFFAIVGVFGLLIAIAGMSIAIAVAIVVSWKRPLEDQAP